MSAASDINRFKVLARTRTQIVFKGAARASLAGIKFGSAITGAPGQPVESQALRDSWTETELSPDAILIAPHGEPVKWAYQNETGIALPGGGLYKQRSAKGGRWSVAKTITGWPAQVHAIVQKLGVRR